MTRPPLPLHKRLIVRTMNQLSWRSGGYVIPFLEEMLHTYSALETFRILRDCFRISEALIGRYGPRDANLLIGFAATWNGCRFCSRSHVWVANLYHLRHTDQLFPLDDADVHGLQQLPDSDLLQRVQQILAGPDYERLRQLLTRQYQLKRGEAEGHSEDDPYLRAAIAAWDWMVECTIVVSDTGDAPADPISSDRALVQRYLALRGRPRR